MSTVAIPAAMNAAVATIDRCDRRLTPHTPCPLVHPLPIRVPKPTSKPATMRTGHPANLAGSQSVASRTASAPKGRPAIKPQALVIAGKPHDAKPHFDAAIDLAPNAGFAKWVAIDKATRIGDIDLLLDPTLPISAGLRAALLKGHRARASSDSGAKAQAVAALLALTEVQQTEAVARLLADLGADREAFQIAARIATTQEYPGPSIFWDQSMRGILADPGFPALATHLGLFKYWTTTRTKPDVCSEELAPPFCEMI